MILIEADSRNNRLTNETMNVYYDYEKTPQPGKFSRVNQ